MNRVARVCFGVLVAGTTVLGTVAASAGDHDADDRKRDGGGGGGGGASVVVPPSTIHGSNFLFKSGLDNTYCIDVAAGSTEGRSVTVSPCAGSDTQKWMMTYNADGQNSMVEAGGMCVDMKGRHAGDGIAVAVNKCHHGGDQKWSYTASAHLKDVKSGKCLSTAKAATGSPVTIEDCDDTKPNQVWKTAR